MKLRIKYRPESIFGGWYVVQIKRFGFWFNLKKRVRLTSTPYNGFGENTVIYKTKVQFLNKRNAIRFVQLLNVLSNAK